MILIGMFDSAFVRRVAITMKFYGMAFEHRNWSVGPDFEQIRRYNPLGRVPTLVLPDGEALIESSAILDYLDECAGPERALLPPSGKDRREALRLMSIASGAADKGVAQIYETVFRPAEKRHQPWVDRCSSQMHAALTELERAAESRGGEWLVGHRMTQADITATCVYTLLAGGPGIDRRTFSYPKLAALVARCEALPEFSSVRAPFFSPGANS
jgi:glutathione S-transferase